MNSVYIHLLVNHAPLFGVLFSLVLFTVSLWKGPDFRKLGYGIILVTLLLSIVTIYSGEAAEERVEHNPGISEQWLETHDEIAELAIWFIIAIAALSIVGIWNEKSNKFAQKTITQLIILLLFISMLFFVRVNYTGGKIEHRFTGNNPEKLQIENNSNSGDRFDVDDDHENGAGKELRDEDDD